MLSSCSLVSADRKEDVKFFFNKRESGTKKSSFRLTLTLLGQNSSLPFNFLIETSERERERERKTKTARQRKRRRCKEKEQEERDKKILDLNIGGVS